jgi:hypothetical protein
MSEPQTDHSDQWYRLLRIAKMVVALLAGLVTVGRALGLL